jgi:hypothetical protein
MALSFELDSAELEALLLGHSGRILWVECVLWPSLSSFPDLDSLLVVPILGFHRYPFLELDAAGLEVFLLGQLGRVLWPSVSSFPALDSLLVVPVLRCHRYPLFELDADDLSAFSPHESVAKAKRHPLNLSLD